MVHEEGNQVSAHIGTTWENRSCFTALPVQILAVKHVVNQVHQAIAGRAEITAAELNRKDAPRFGPGFQSMKQALLKFQESGDIPRAVAGIPATPAKDAVVDVDTGESESGKRYQFVYRFLAKRLSCNLCASFVIDSLREICDTLEQGENPKIRFSRPA